MLLTTTPVVGIQDEEPILDTTAFDRSVRIQDDLFLHVNGAWLENTAIPDDKSNYGSFGKLADLSQLRIKKLIEKTANETHEPGSNAQKIADFYTSFMADEKIEDKGYRVLESELAKIDALDSKEAVWKHFGYLSSIGVRSPVGFYVSQDAGEATQYICQLAQSGTSLPDRDYYLKQDEQSAQVRAALLDYIQTILSLSQIDASHLAAEEIVGLEKKLAEASWARVQLRNAKKRYNKKTFAELGELTSGKLDWSTYFKSAGVAATPESVNVNTPSFFEALSGLVEETPLKTWKDYLRYRLIDSYAPFMSIEFVDAHFELYEKQIQGIPVQRPRWKRAVNAIAGAGAGDFGALGEAVGELYVAKFFKPEAKAKMDGLVQNLLKAFGGSIDDLTWMTDETKGRAKEKLSKIKTKIGYPNVWRDYSKLVVKPDDLFGNVLRSNQLEYKRNMDHLGKPIDREEWGMTPQTVNAYYSPTKNEIVFPAAILQAPFFSMNAPDALNYGGIGAVIGHEISHAFDDQGSQYDGDGNLKNWWTEEDGAAFKDLTTRLIAQYAQYEPLKGEKVNGELTLGENIADLSGLTIAHRALTISREGKPDEKVAGWNTDQLFFVGWSRVWQRKYRDKEMIKRLLTDSHSPSQYRANGPVTNIDAFYKAFDVKPEDNLFKREKDRIKIW
ncbi:MAG: M13 family metallopeptidase [Mariniblastus sp.]